MFKVNESHTDYANADWSQSVFTFALIGGSLFSHIRKQEIFRSSRDMFWWFVKRSVIYESRRTFV